MGFADFAKRHRRKVAIALGVGAAAYWAVSYVTQKLQDLQAKLLLDRATQEDLARRFEQNQRDATFTTMALFPTVSTQIVSEFDVESTRQALKELRSDSSHANLAASQSSLADSQVSLPGQSASPAPETVGSPLTGSSFLAPRSKAELWNELKISSVTRAFVLIYTGAFLTLLTRIQLNILGRLAYADHVAQVYDPTHPNSGASESESAEQLNREYLTFSWWLLHEGWRALAQRIQPVVESVMADLAPTNKLGLKEMESVLGRIHQRVTTAGEFANVVLPPPEQEGLVREQTHERPVEIGSELRALLTETLAIANSTSARYVLDEMVHNALAVLTSQLRPSFPVDGEVRLANALLVIAAQGREMAAGSPLRNVYMDAMVAVPQLDALSAAIYSNYAQEE